MRMRCEWHSLGNVSERCRVQWRDCANDIARVRQWDRIDRWRRSSLRRLMSPLSQNKAPVYFGYPEGIGNSYLRFPKSKQMKSWFTFGYPMGGDSFCIMNFEFRINRPYSLADGTWCLQRDLVIGEQRCCYLEVEKLAGKSASTELVDVRKSRMIFINTPWRERYRGYYWQTPQSCGQLP